MRVPQRCKTIGPTRGMSMNEMDAPADNGVHFERAKEEEEKRVLSGRVPTYACMCAPSQHNRAGDDEGRDEAMGASR